MSISGSNSLYSSISNKSFGDLPNLPGIKRDISTANPKLYREFKSSQMKSNPHLGQFFDAPFHSGRDLEDERFVNEENSLTSGSVLADVSKALSPFQASGSRFNDLSGRYGLYSQKKDRLQKTMSLPYCSTDSLPPFVSGAKFTYRITATYDEETPENLLELFRTRKVDIIVHGEDNTIEIIEPKTNNSALVQGRILKRHKVLKNTKKHFTEGMIPSSTIRSIKGDTRALNDNASNNVVDNNETKPYFTINDFWCGAEPVIYGRKYLVIDGDRATRSYFQDVLGRDFGPALPLPASYYEPKSKEQMDALRKQLSTSPNKKAAIDQYGQLSRSYKAAAFFVHANKTLRFIGVWDNRAELFGDKIFVKIHYTLKDHQIEIIPLVERNSGRDKLGVLLKKTTLLKKDGYLPTFSELADSSSAVGTITDSTITHSLVTGLLHMPDRPMNGPRPYSWDDLYIGLNLTMASANITIIDADEFTREFYKSQGKPLAEPLTSLTIADVHPGATQPVTKADDPAAPPGFLPTNPPKDGAKAKLYQGMILRYEAKLYNPKPADESRVFIIQVHLEDDSVQVREPPLRNTGHLGGIFLARDRFESKDLGRYLLPEDISIGKIVQVMSHRFVVFNADEYTIRYMESNEDRWAASNVKLVLKKLQQKLEVLQKLILTTPNIQSAEVDYDGILDMLVGAGLDIIKQEAMTICRYIDPTRSGKVKLSKFLKAVINSKN